MLLHKRAERVYMAVRLVGEYAGIIRDAGSMPFNELGARSMQIRQVDSSSIGPILTSGTQAAINTVLTRFIAGWGADPFTQLGVVHNAVGPFLTAANTLRGSMGDPVSWTPAGEVWVTVTGLQLAALHPSLDAILAAVAPLSTPTE